MEPSSLFRVIRNDFTPAGPISPGSPGTPLPPGSPGSPFCPNKIQMKQFCLTWGLKGYFGNLCFIYCFVPFGLTRESRNTRKTDISFQTESSRKTRGTLVGRTSRSSDLRIHFILAKSGKSYRYSRITNISFLSREAWLTGSSWNTLLSFNATTSWRPTGTLWSRGTFVCRNLN